MKLIIFYVRKHNGMFFLTLLFLCIEAGADLLQPTYMAHIVDEGVTAQNGAAILSYGLIMVIIAICGACGAIVRNIYSNRTSQLIGKEMRSDLYRKVQTLSFSNIDRLQTASMITRITNDVTQIQNFINRCMRILVKAPITCIGAILLIIVQTPQQVPVLTVILLISALLIYCNAKLGYPRYGRLQQKLDRLNTISREFLYSIRVVKAFCAEEEESEKFFCAASDFSQASISAMQVLAVFSPLINLTVNLGILFLLWLSQAGDPGQIGRLMASVNYMTQVLFALGMVSNILNSSVRALSSAQRVDEIFQEVPAQEEALCPIMPKLTGQITLNHVSFCYPGASREALSQISIEIQAGETIGIIGATGSGKSTLVKLIPRFYDASSGRVLLNHCDVTQIERGLLQKTIAVVPQKALLFSGSIRKNLLWGDELATEEQLWNALSAACAEEFVRQLPHGLDTILGQGGVNLSGGQKQRISLARALLRNGSILILDDCTSALDSSTETQVLQSLKLLARQTTVLLISQRISTVMGTHRILCLDNGQVAGFGDHQHLLDHCPTYQAIYHSQIGGDPYAGKANDPTSC